MASRAKKGWHSPGPSREASSEKQEEVDGEREDAAKSEARLGATSAGVLEYSDGAKGKRKWYRYLNPLRWQQVPPVPTEKRTTREYGANLLSQITFHWMAPLMTTGYLRPIEQQDIWLVHPDRALEVTPGRLLSNFKHYLAQGSKHPLLWALYATFKKDFLLGGVCALSASLLQVFSLYTTRYLISFATEAWVSKHYHQPEPNIGRGIGLVIGICAMQLVQSLTMNMYFYRGMVTGGQARATIIDAIFTKSTRVSARARAGGKAPASEQSQEDQKNATEEVRHARDNIVARMFHKGHAKEHNATPHNAAAIAGDGTGWSNGRIIALMSIDTDRVDKAFGLFHLVWTSPVLVIVTLILLLVNIGYSCLSGFALIVIVMPLLVWAMKSLIRRRMKINQVTDKRVSLTQEILQAVRFVKYFGWESSFLDRLKDLRRREIAAVQKVQAIRNALMCAAMSLPIFASVLSFVTYALSKHTLTAAPVFSSLALFNALRQPLNMLPLVFAQVADASTAIKRIQEFLLAEEQGEAIEHDESLEDALVLQDACFTWERTPTDSEDSLKKGKKKGKKEAKKMHMKGRSQTSDNRATNFSNPEPETEHEPFKLEQLNLSIHRKELIAVIGSVGCGKTSLLSALAGDMRLIQGTAKMNATRAYCPQYAWIQNATVRDNIIFGKAYDEEWYNEVIDACALRADLESFMAGDQTEIGERGITVSGGQKQRLNIARAIYFDTELVLLDDPLSAVDAHVGRHIMDNAICGLLKDKCRILATHQLHVLSRCDRIIVMDQGKIESIGTYDQLMEESEGFKRLLSTTAQEGSSKPEEQESSKDEEITEAENADKSAMDKSTPAAPSGPLMQAEERATSSVGWDVWKAYISSFGTYGFLVNLPLILVSLIASNGGNVVTSLWLSWWTSENFDLPAGVYMGMYAGLGGIQVLLMFTFSTAMSLSTTNASRTMFLRAMTRVLRAPMSFFDTTPLGRITNRFSKDIHTMDNELTDAMRIFYLTVSLIISVLILVIVFFHWFALALVPLSIFFIIATNYYRVSARQIKRHEAVLRSVVFAQFGEAITGIPTIRAYGLQNFFTQRLRKALDDMNSAYFLTFANQRWLSVRLDAIGNLMVFVTGILVVTSRFDVSPSSSGLVLSYILSIVMMLQFTVRQLAEVENNMNATERVHFYATSLEEEAPLRLREVDSVWPQHGSIKFDDVRMRYRAGLPLVLKGLTMEVRGGEKIGIVGRTGAGKSSIMSALFRLTELSGGRISIDGIDISTIGLHDLRSRLAIIPQDPALFRGTVRSNLDPFNEHTDLELWSALRKAGLVGDDSSGASNDQQQEGASADQPSRIHLETSVEEDGLNFSLGQRQLMALARALVRDSKIIVADEATSSVDFETDQNIQRTILREFKGKTLLVIAHRLRTIIHYDRICVMDQGVIAELDHPLTLWERDSSIFRGMCDRSGITRDDFNE